MNSLQVAEHRISIIPKLESLTPSRFGALQDWKNRKRCALQELWRGKALLAPTPTAKLGDVIHRMLDRLQPNARESEARDAWDEALRHTESGLQSDWVSRGLLPLENTARRFTLKKMLALRGVVKHPSTDTGESPVGATTESFREAELVSHDKLLRGKADLIVKKGLEWFLIDYKSGTVHEDDDESGSQRIKVAYSLQLMLYAHLVREAKGIVINRAFLQTLDGQQHEVALNEARASAAGDEARSLLKDFNSAVAGKLPTEVAKPMAACREDDVFGCGGCLFRPSCQAYLEAEKTTLPGKSWPKDAWGKVTSMRHTPGRVEIEVENANIVKDDTGKRILPTLWISLETGSRHQHLLRIEEGNHVGVFDYLKSRSSAIAQDGPRTCVYPISPA